METDSGSWGAVCQGLGSRASQLREPGRRSGPEEKQHTFVGEGRGGGEDHPRNIFLSTHKDSQRVGLWMGRHFLPPVWAKQYGLGQTTTVSSDSRGGSGSPPLGACEQVRPVAPVTSEFSTKEGIATKYHQLLLSLP